MVAPEGFNCRQLPVLCRRLRFSLPLNSSSYAVTLRLFPISAHTSAIIFSIRLSASCRKSLTFFNGVWPHKFHSFEGYLLGIDWIKTLCYLVSNCLITGAQKRKRSCSLKMRRKRLMRCQKMSWCKRSPKRIGLGSKATNMHTFRHALRSKKQLPSSWFLSPSYSYYRFVIASIYKPELLGQAMTNTLEEGLVVYITSSLFSFLFRHFEPKFDFAEIKNEFISADPITGKKCDSGTCSKCGGITIIGRERFISFFSFLGKSSEYFCGNCNRFIMGNPLNNIFLGITESVASFLFMTGIASNMQGKSSSHLSIVILILLVGIYDGIKRVFFGIKGVKRSIIK